MQGTELRSTRADLLWVSGAVTISVLFGLTMVLNIHPAGDGLWFWYAASVRQHHLLYTDLHFNLQPLFVLLTAWFQILFGEGWLASKVLPTCQLLAFCAGLAFISRYIPWRTWQRATILLAGFALTIASRFYRFDDYHITTQIFSLYSVCLLLLLRSSQPKRHLLYCSLLGVLCGLSLANRINDGAGLYLGCVGAAFLLVRASRWRNLAVISVFAGLTFLCVLLLTGDSLQAWLEQSILLASRIKGGSGHILLGPFTLPARFAKDVLGTRPLKVFLTIVAAFALLPTLLRRVSKRARRPVIVVFGLGIFAACARLLMDLFAYNPSSRLAEIGLLFLFVLVTWFLIRVLARFRFRTRAAPETVEALLLVPFLGLYAAAMTSGTSFPEYEPSAAIFLLLVPIVLPWGTDRLWLRRVVLVLAGVIIVATLIAKSVRPYAWHHYIDGPMFTARVWYPHPELGPMYIERRQLAFMLPLCSTIAASGPGASLLSLPYPYPNYFCGLPPWDGYVQTWYDTSGPETIRGLETKLDAAPPRWIVYQRGLDSMRAHEVVFQQSRKLPHRELDRQLMAKIVDGQWTIVQRSCFEGADWLLIRTTAPRAGEHVGIPADAEDKGQYCPDNAVH